MGREPGRQIPQYHRDSDTWAAKETLLSLRGILEQVFVNCAYLKRAKKIFMSDLRSCGSRRAGPRSPG